MKLIFCLGNPGEKYKNTRHNVGFMFADMLNDKLSSSFKHENKFKADISKAIYNNQAVWIVKPLTYMNLSGETLLALNSYFKTDIKDFFLVYDDIALDLGSLRFKSKGSDGGHNGVKSIIKYAQTQEFNRLKIGIGPQPPFLKSEDFVLQNFDSQQFLILNQVLSTAIEAFLMFCDCEDITKVQNKYN